MGGAIGMVVLSVVVKIVVLIFIDMDSNEKISDGKIIYGIV